MTEDLDTEGKSILKRVHYAIYYLASRRNGNSPDKFRLNPNKYWKFLRHLQATSIMLPYPHIGEDWFLFQGIEIHLKRDRKFYADR